jgi:hypothetical protein
MKAGTGAESRARFDADIQAQKPFPAGFVWFKME